MECLNCKGGGGDGDGGTLDFPFIHYNAMQIFGADRIERLMKSPQLPSMN